MFQVNVTQKLYMMVTVCRSGVKGKVKGGQESPAGMAGAPS